jgi:integrase
VLIQSFDLLPAVEQYRADGMILVQEKTQPIRKLDVAMQTAGLRSVDAEPLLADERGRHSDPKPTPYSAEEADRLITKLYQRDPQYGQLAQLQRVASLRREEAVHLQARCIAEDGSMVTLDGTGTHAKGGREREIPIREQDRDFMQALRAQGLTHKNSHVFVQRQTLGRARQRRNARYVACKRLGIENRGTHGFRKTWATEYYADLCETGLSNQDARREVSHGLGHNRVNVLRHYLPQVSSRRIGSPTSTAMA